MEIKGGFAYLFKFPVKKSLSSIWIGTSTSQVCVQTRLLIIWRKKDYFNLRSIAAQGQADSVIDGVGRSGQSDSSGKTGLSHTMEVLKGFIGRRVIASCSECCR